MAATLSISSLFFHALAQQFEANATVPHLPVQGRAPTSFWYANIDHTSAAVRGYAPDLDGDHTYAVYKEVSPSGGGQAIQEAINSGSNGARRHGMWFASQPRVCSYSLPCFSRSICFLSFFSPHFSGFEDVVSLSLKARTNMDRSSTSLQENISSARQF